MNENVSVVIEEPTPAALKAPTLMEQITWVFIQPTALFGRLRKAPSWVGPFLLFMILNLLIAILWSKNLDLEGYLTAMLEKAHLPPGTNMDQILDMQKKVFIPFNILGVLLGVPALIFFMAFLFWLVGKWAAEQAPTYPQCLAAWVTPLLVGLPKTALTLVMCVAKKGYTVDPEKLTPTSLGYFLHPENPKLRALLYALDPFTAAQLILMFLALRHVLRYKPVPAWAMVLVPYLGLMFFSIQKAA